MNVNKLVQLLNKDQELSKSLYILRSTRKQVKTAPVLVQQSSVVTSTRRPLTTGEIK